MLNSWSDMRSRTEGIARATARHYPSPERFAPDSPTRGEDPGSRRRDDHPARLAGPAGTRRLRGLCRGSRWGRGGGSCALGAAGSGSPRRQDAEAGRDRGSSPDPRGAADPDRDADRIRPGRSCSALPRPVCLATRSSPFREQDPLPAIRRGVRGTTSLTRCARRRSRCGGACGAQAIERAKGLLMEKEGLWSRMRSRGCARRARFPGVH